MARTWLGPYEWVTIGAVSFWRAPAGTVAQLDFRSVSASGAPGPAASGSGLFVTPDAVDLGGAYLEVDPILGPVRRDAIQAFLGLPDPVTATLRRELIVDFFTRHARVAGDTFGRPLLPNSRGLIQLTIGALGIEFADRPQPGSPYWAKVAAVYQLSYRRIRQRVLDGLSPAGQHRKFLGQLLWKLRADYHEFIPNDLPDEGPLPPTTTIADAFTRADADPLGSSSEGWSWTEVAGDIDIVSNQAKSGAAGHNHARAESDLSSDDHVVTVTQVDFGAGAGPLARFDPSANTCYVLFSDGVFRIFKNVTGTYTEIGADTGSVANGSIIKLQVDGSQITSFDDGVQQHSFTDTAIVGFTRTGIVADGTGSGAGTLDDFQATDLAVPPIPYAGMNYQQELRPRPFAPGHPR